MPGRIGGDLMWAGIGQLSDSTRSSAVSAVKRQLVLVYPYPFLPSNTDDTAIVLEHGRNSG